MKKFTPIALFVAAALSAPMLAQAATFSVDIEITNQQTSLSLSESIKMKFPTIIIDGSTANNQACYTYTASSTSTLCPGAIIGTDKNNSSFAITGTPLDSISINYTSPTGQNGLALSVGGSSSIILDNSGAGSFDARAILQLTDITAIQPATTFEYEVVVSYT